jgi:hypothetical protein
MMMTEHDFLKCVGQELVRPQCPSPMSMDAAILTSFWDSMSTRCDEDDVDVDAAEYIPWRDDTLNRQYQFLCALRHADVEERTEQVIDWLHFDARMDPPVPTQRVCLMTPEELCLTVIRFTRPSTKATYDVSARAVDYVICRAIDKAVMPCTDPHLTLRPQDGLTAHGNIVAIGRAYDSLTRLIHCTFFPPATACGAVLTTRTPESVRADISRMLMITAKLSKRMPTLVCLRLAHTRLSEMRDVTDYIIKVFNAALLQVLNPRPRPRPLPLPPPPNDDVIAALVDRVVSSVLCCSS